MTTQHGKFSPQHKSTWAEKFAWGAGGMTESLQNSIWALSFPIYSIALGVSPALIGLAKALPRVVDAFTDPIMGNISDNARTRFGRRRPVVQHLVCKSESARQPHTGAFRSGA
jgi:GPH family glycoside/pentoside/hexuronide:cation symporter